MQKPQSITKFVLPLTLVSFFCLNKWWYVTPVDARQTYFWGFPFAFVGEGWQTSGALQFFVLEWLADFSVFFLFWFAILYLLKRFIAPPMPPKWLLYPLWSLSFLAILAGGTIIAFSYPTFKLKRDFDWEVIQSGYKFVWQRTPQLASNSHQNTKE